ncbi:hypothetical protein Dip518_000820 [Parelusimicrobium proximum]|uniref:hypothetical protein n=1 Tax=Parelusimicrobium proximum TaxID=3228953 RepID=UPI003D16EEF3
MKHLKANLTNLQKKVIIKLPEGNDVLDFKGVSRELISKEIEKIRRIVTYIENEEDNSFELISLKREAAKLHNQLGSLADKGFEDKDRFNDFLTKLSALSDKVVLTYLLTNKNGMRNEDELINIKNQIQDVREGLISLTELHTEYEKLCEGIVKNKEEAENSYKRILTAETSSTEKAASIKAKEEEMLTLLRKSTSRNTSIKNMDEALSKIKEQIENLHSTSTKTQEITDTNNKVAEETSLKCAENQQTAEETLKKAEAVLEGATRVGLAKSFATRKEEVGRTQLVWGIVFAVSILSLIAIIFLTNNLFPLSVDNPISYLNLIPKVLFTAPVVWLGWFASSQYSHLDKVKEDYSFKFALSMAYDGYKKAIESVTDEENRELTQKLLDTMLDTLAHNPSDLLAGKKASVTPHRVCFKKQSIKSWCYPR